ncbi:MAG: TetR/AcrR family transcriptional regulator, partial [Acidimicrobiia bacterium]
MSELSPREQRRQQHQELSRAQILDAAEAVFARKGFHDATVKEIAAAAEFSVGGVYSFFADKDDVFVQIYLRRGAEFMAGMRAVLAEPGTPRAALHRLAGYQVQFFREHTNFGRLYLRGSGATLGDLITKTDQAVVENYTEAMNLQTKLFRDGQDAGELRDGDPEVLAVLFSGLVAAFQSTDISDERMTLAELHEILDGAF